jgi:hypothetical protein
MVTLVHQQGGVSHKRVRNCVAVFHMLRGLSQHCESGTYPQLAWGGITAKSWQESSGLATFRFSLFDDRESLMRDTTRLLPTGMWTLVSTDDHDPARPRRR